MDHEQEVRKLYGDDLQLDSSIIDTDEHEAVIKIIRGGWDDHGIACVVQGSQSVTLADAVLAS